jgi:hypothetical protein
MFLILIQFFLLFFKKTFLHCSVGDCSLLTINKQVAIVQIKISGNILF